MKLWKITPMDPYTGGCALVAAETIEQAYLLLQQYDEYLEEWMVSLTGDEVNEISYSGSEAKVIFSHIYLE